jgi:rhamnosyltransferase
MKVLALIVSHNGEETICHALNSCLTDKRISADISTLVIDNASTDGTLAAIKSLNFHPLEIIQMPCNVGVATAYNIGLKKAKALGVRWLFLLDQDSGCLHCCLRHLLEEIDMLENRGEKVGAICACARSWLFPDTIHFPYYWKDNALVTAQIDFHSAEIVTPIDSSLSSGTLYNVEALSALGGFREDYFIDFVDHECHLRLRKAEWGIWWHKHALLYHRLGISQKMTKEGLWIEHAPYRYYYMGRNMFEGLRRLGGKSAARRFIRRDIFGHIQRLRRYGKSPWKSSFFMIRGVIDGYFGRFNSRFNYK